MNALFRLAMVLLVVGGLAAACTSEDTPGVKQIDLSRDVKRSGDKIEAIDKTTVFKPTDTINALVLIGAAEKKPKVKVVWTAVEAGTSKDEVVYEEEATANEDRNVLYSILRPSANNTLPVGRYKIDTYYNGDLAKSAEFQVQAQ
jgi:hypothetical protein